jgi:hypothetical protein
MSDCATVSMDNAPLMPNKRVNYPRGMVLGVDEFLQEAEHFEWKHRLSNQLLHGYGTVCGLKVTATPMGADDVEIRIARGAAISPTGRWIWVERDQCARLKEWLARHGDELGGPLRPGPHTVYVKLCYTECPTDEVPIAAEPCATEEETRAPSRILETFRAEFAWAPPPQHAEDAYRRFGELLRRLDVTREPPSPDDGERFLELVRGLGTVVSPPAIASPPEDEILRLWEGPACETIRKAILIWITEVCPQLEAPGEECILLACVHFTVTAGALVPATVDVDGRVRPVLASDRLKQEMVCLSAHEGPTGPTGPTGSTPRPACPWPPSPGWTCSSGCSSACRARSTCFSSGASWTGATRRTRRRPLRRPLSRGGAAPPGVVGLQSVGVLICMSASTTGNSDYASVVA